MHIVFAARGVKHMLDSFENFATTKMYEWERKNLKTGKMEKSIIQGALRPIRLYEYIMPEEYLDEAGNMFQFDESGKVHPFTASFNAKLLQKAMGLKPLKFKKQNTLPLGKILPRPGVALYPIGMKKDKKQDWDEIGYNQEML